MHYLVSYSCSPRNRQDWASVSLQFLYLPGSFQSETYVWWGWREGSVYHRHMKDAFGAEGRASERWKPSSLKDEPWLVPLCAHACVQGSDWLVWTLWKAWVLQQPWVHFPPPCRAGEGGCTDAGRVLPTHSQTHFLILFILCEVCRYISFI